MIPPHPPIGRQARAADLTRRALKQLKTSPESVHFDISKWLEDGDRVVTRKELYEFISRLEVGKRMRNRWRSRLRRFGRRLWGWLARSPLDAEDRWYR